MPTAALTQPRIPASLVPIPTCPQPNVGAATVDVAKPVIPQKAIDDRAYGNVFVFVALDANSQITGVSIARSPSPDLNAAALDAARRSKFTTTIRDCTPIADTFTLDVEFRAPGSPSPSPAASATP